jgi:3-hydroxyisobutyrate dehydrogenase-like beta-hydroxyacid dehydrogenase
MMVTTTVALLHPGEMGVAVGACARARGARVVWASEGRSPATRERAEAAGLEDLETLPATVAASDVVVSVCPPHGAVELARAVSGLGFRGVFVDGNAVSPDTSREIGRIVETTGATFVDGGIVGPPPGSGRGTRLYLSGKGAEGVAALFAESALATVVLDGGIGAASALKVCYAAWTKGATALIADVRALAAHAGVDAALVAEWTLSQPEALTRSGHVTASARKAWRWIAEMEEIAATFAAAGLPDGFHRAAAEIYARLEGYQNASGTPALADITDALRGGRGGPGPTTG